MNLVNRILWISQQKDVPVTNPNLGQVCEELISSKLEVAFVQAEVTRLNKWMNTFWMESKCVLLAEN